MKLIRLFLLSSLLILIVTTAASAQTTGKIAGRITDERSKEPLLGVNILVENTTLGAATDANGDFYIINIPPGRYKLRVQMIGYQTLYIENVNVSVNRTSNVNAALAEAVIQGKEVTITAEKIAIKKDQTGSIKNVNADEIKVLPVQSLDNVIGMQAGVVQGHFRGGRTDEVSYMIDGMSVNQSFQKSNRSISVELNVIREVEVITGTFNAEYGNAMSGVVNAVTKDGADELHGAASISASNYYTSQTDVFPGLKSSDFARSKDFKLFLEGPVIPKYVSFILNGRLQDNKGYLNGIRRFNPDNYSNFTNSYGPYSNDFAKMKWMTDINGEAYYSENTGDGSYVSMDQNESYSLYGKLSFKPFTNFRASFTYSKNYSKYYTYNHYWKYNPDGRAPNYQNSDLFALQLNHFLTNSIFYEFKASYTKDYIGSYLYKDPSDPRYVHDAYARLEKAGFYTGGQSKNHTEQFFNDLLLKYDITWQMNKQHTLKLGASFNQHDFDNRFNIIRNKYYGMPNADAMVYDTVSGKMIFPNYAPVIFTQQSIYVDNYRVKPREGALYLQDKMEFSSMVINLGLRYDIFDPNVDYPSEWRNPSNQIVYTDHLEMMSTFTKAPVNTQLSPRLGVSYQLGDQAVLRFAYGHFFQMPSLYSLYVNSNRLVSPNKYETTMGNPLLKPQKTVQYEIGLWQQIATSMSAEVTVFYRDIYDLLSTKIITTFNQVPYGLYTNKDYGNVRGMELKYNYFSGPLMASINYTLQYTRGVADIPTSAFTRAGSNMDPLSRLIPMEWDQRHTLNLSVGYNEEKYGATLTAYYNSGTPYTWRPLPESSLSLINLLPNNSVKPSTLSLDLSGYYNVGKFSGVDVKITFLVSNLLDRLNTRFVNDQTGTANTAILRPVDYMNHVSNFNDVFDAINNPASYEAPREIKIGLDLSF